MTHWLASFPTLGHQRPGGDMRHARPAPSGDGPVLSRLQRQRPGPALDASNPALCPGSADRLRLRTSSARRVLRRRNIGNKLRVVLAPGIYVMAGGGVRIGATGSLDSVQAPGPCLRQF